MAFSLIDQISVISFDLDDTLYDNHPVIVRTEQAMRDWLHQTYPETHSLALDYWQDLKQQIVVDQPMLKHDVTHWRWVVLKTGFMKLGYDDNQAIQIADKAIDYILAVRNDIDMPLLTHQVLSALSQHFPLVAISNGNADVDKIGLAPYFSLVLRAGRDGLSKPESDMFMATCQHFSIAPNALLHVGDHMLSDVIGAQLSGVNACWFNPKQQIWLPKEACYQSHQPDWEIQQLTDLYALLPSE